MKSWYQSKTVIFNLIMTVVLFAPIIAAAAEAVTPQMAVLIDSIAGLITGLGNVVLRVWFTDAPIATPQARAKQRARLDAQIEARQDELQRLY